MYSETCLPKELESNNKVFVMTYNLSTLLFTERSYITYISQKGRYMFKHEISLKNGIRPERIGNLQYDESSTTFMILSDKDNRDRDRCLLFKCVNKHLAKLVNNFNKQYGEE